MKTYMTLPFLLMILLAACTEGGERQEPAAKDLSATEFNEQMEELDNEQVLDVRTPEEWAEGTIPGATKINFYDEDFAQQLDQLDKDKPVMIYCRSGNRSGQAVDVLEQGGFTEIYHLESGMLGWEAEGYEVEK